MIEFGWAQLVTDVTSTHDNCSSDDSFEFDVNKKKKKQSQHQHRSVMICVNTKKPYFYRQFDVYSCIKYLLFSLLSFARYVLRALNNIEAPILQSSTNDWCGVSTATADDKTLFCWPRHQQESHRTTHKAHRVVHVCVCVSCECVVRCGWRVVYCWTFKDDFINSRVAKVLESAECLWRWWIYTHPVNFRFVMHKLLRGVKNRIKRVTRQFNLLYFTSVNLVVRS